MNTHSPYRILTLTAAMALGNNALAQTTNVSAGMGSSFNKMFTARIGYLWTEADTRVRLDSSNGDIGADINFEDSLGLQSSKGISLGELSWRINLHHRIDFSYTGLSRDGEQRLTADIDFGDNTYTIGTDVNSIFSSDIWRLAWGWSWINDSKVEFGSLLGLHVTEIKVGIRGANGLLSEEEATTIPLPTIGLQGSYAFTPKWHLRGWFQWFALEYDKYDGSLFNTSVALDYYAFDNVGIGLGYNYYRYDLTVADDHQAIFDYTFHGPMLYANIYF